MSLSTGSRLMKPLECKKLEKKEIMTSVEGGGKRPSTGNWEGGGKGEVSRRQHHDALGRMPKGAVQLWFTGAEQNNRKASINDQELAIGQG